MKRIAVMMVVIALTTVGRLWADLVIEEQVNPGDGSPSVPSMIYVGSDRLAFHEGTMGTIFLADRPVLWQYDTHQQIYLEFTPASLKGLKAQSEAMVTQAVSALKQQLDGASDDQKAALTQAIEEMQRGPQYTFARTGVTKTIAGIPCVEVTVTLNGQAESTLCAARLADTGITPAEMKPFDALDAFYSTLGPLASSASFSYPGLDAFLGYRAFPVEESHPGPGGMSVTTLVSITRKPVSPSLFTLPPGLTKQDVLAGN